MLHIAAKESPAKLCRCCESGIVAASSLFSHLLFSLSYVVKELHVSPQHFIARIGAKNVSSIALFEQLGFHKAKYVEVWDEVEMRWAHKPNVEDKWSKTNLINRLGLYEADEPCHTGQAA